MTTQYLHLKCAILPTLVVALQMLHQATSRDGDGMDDTEKIKEPNQSIRMEQKIQSSRQARERGMSRCTSSWQRACDCRLRRGDRRSHGTSGPGGLFDVLGRIPCRPTVSDTSIRANTYLIFETRLGYISKTYPTRIGYAIRYPLEVSAHHSWQGTTRVVHILMHSCG